MQSAWIGKGDLNIVYKKRDNLEEHLNTASSHIDNVLYKNRNVDECIEHSLERSLVVDDKDSASVKIIYNPVPVDRILDAYNDCNFRCEEKYLVLPDEVREKIERVLYAWIDENPPNRIVCSNTMGLALTLYAHAVHHTTMDWNKFVEMECNGKTLIRIFRAYKTCIPEPGTLMGEIVAQFFQHCKQQSNLNVKRTMNKQQHPDGGKSDNCVDDSENIFPKENCTSQDSGLFGNHRRHSIDSKFEVIMSMKRVPTVIIMLTTKQCHVVDCESDVIDYFGKTVLCLEKPKRDLGDNLALSNHIVRKYRNVGTSRMQTVNGKAKFTNNDTNRSRARKKGKDWDGCKPVEDILRKCSPELHLKQFYNKIGSDVFIQVTLTRNGYYDMILDEFFKRIYLYNTREVYDDDGGDRSQVLLSHVDVVFCSDTLYFMNMSKRLFIDNSIIFLYCYLTDKYKPVIESRNDTDTFGLVKMMTCIEYCTQSSLKRRNNSKIGHGPLTSVISEGGLNESTKFVNNLLRKQMLNVDVEQQSASLHPSAISGPSKMFVINEPYINTFLNKPVDCGNMY